MTGTFKQELVIYQYSLHEWMNDHYGCNYSSFTNAIAKCALQRLFLSVASWTCNRFSRMFSVVAHFHALGVVLRFGNSQQQFGAKAGVKHQPIKGRFGSEMTCAHEERCNWGELRTLSGFSDKLPTLSCRVSQSDRRQWGGIHFDVSSSLFKKRSHFKSHSGFCVL